MKLPADAAWDGAGAAHAGEFFPFLLLHRFEKALGVGLFLLLAFLVASAGMVTMSIKFYTEVTVRSIRSQQFLVSATLGLLTLGAFMGLVLGAFDAVRLWRIIVGVLAVLTGLALILNLALQRLERMHQQLKVSLMVNPGGTLVCAGFALASPDNSRFWIVGVIAAVGIIVCIAAGFAFLIRYKLALAKQSKGLPSV